ncbi:rhodanese-like domain-containing protein [Thermoleptolyngbya sp. C42_A2020_037]|uniref:rhodanese-like domain-containing protein n=1 Tax=Thermoleptolyngbya sp. C42_A2020_037 TaxID=2747799 RepID=UPI0019EB9026|nr:rhodanese-like domain-containing protein [Thermoleptolyngbya sp. C42_A2020_037]MBF2083110.1 rhodanese-like domain-containing protein [Thermoleptolyngbya sp. C42_A2020_037]
MTSMNEIGFNYSSQTQRDRLKAIDPSFLSTLLSQQAVTLVDVREPSEHAGEKIPGSILVPLSKFDPNRIPFGGNKDGNKTVVLYCRTGNRSAQAAQKLFAAGIDEVTHLEGGLSAWVQAGFPTEVNKRAPISLMRQVQIVAGSLVVTGTLLGAFVSPWFLLLSGFVGAGLVFAGITNTCALGMLLAKLPYNQRV